MTQTEIDLGARLDVMEAVARRAGALALRYFHARDQLQIETKRVLTDMVSQADREVEDLIRDALRTTFPEDAFMGEEYGLEPGTSKLTWVVDPIDGTAPYLNGLPGWCVSIGLMDERGPLLGVIYVPVLEEMFRGGRGQGATLNGQPIRVTERFDLTTGLLGVGFNDRVPARRIGQLQADLAAEGIAQVRYGSGAMMLAYVAAGRLVGYCEPRMSVWDCLAAYALIEAAGGRVAAISNGAMKGKPFPVLGATRRDYERLAALTRFDARDWVLA
ncbi:MAG: inositol monophosphatase [Paracoccus sp. (in: a-proteobacteria)]